MFLVSFLVLPLLCWVRAARGPAPCNLEGPREGSLKESMFLQIPCVRANSGKSSSRKIACATRFVLALSAQSGREHFCMGCASLGSDPHWYLRSQCLVLVALLGHPGHLLIPRVQGHRRHGRDRVSILPLLSFGHAILGGWLLSLGASPDTRHPNRSL